MDYWQKFLETYRQCYQLAEFYCHACDEGLEIRGEVDIADGKIKNNFYFFDPKKSSYRQDISDKFAEVSKEIAGPSKLAMLCFSLRHFALQQKAISYCRRQEKVHLKGKV